MSSLAGLEPAIFPLGGGRVIHYATETLFFYFFLFFSFVLLYRKNILQQNHHFVVVNFLACVKWFIFLVKVLKGKPVYICLILMFSCLCNFFSWWYFWRKINQFYCINISKYVKGQNTLFLFNFNVFLVYIIFWLMIFLKENWFICNGTIFKEKNDLFFLTFTVFLYNKFFYFF